MLGPRPTPFHPPKTADGEPAPKRRAFRKKTALVAAASLLAILGGGFVAAGPIVRARVVEEGARRNLDVTVGGARPGFFAVTLHDVRVRPRGVEGVEVRLDDVRVDLTAGLSVSEIAGHGGEIKLDGEPEEIADRLRAFKKDAPAEASGAKRRRTPVSADGLAIAWKLPSGGEVTGSGIKLARGEDAMRFGCETLTASYRQATMSLAGADVELAMDGAPRRVSATTLSLSHAAPAAPAAKVANAGAQVDPAPPPLPAVAVKTRGKTVAAKSGKAAPPTPPAPEEPVLPLPDLHDLRTRIAGLASTFGARVPDGSKVDIGGLSVKLDLGGDPFAFGPGPFSLERRADRVHVTFASDGAQQAGGTPLSIDAELPLAAGDVTVRLSGGPVSLALLGVKDGTKGLFDVAKGSVSGKGQLVLAAAGDSLTFDGQIALRSISIKQPRLSHEPLRGLDFAVSAKGLLDDAGKLRVDDAQLDMGALHVRSHGTIEETRDHFAVALSADVAPASCQALLDSVPRGLLPTVSAARMTGTFGATSRVVFDTRAIDKLTLDYQIADQCRMSEVPRELSRDRFSGAFTYRTYHPDGTPSDTTTGPGTSSWADLDAISPFMIAAVLTTEDGAFYRHKGFNHAAIRSSVAANLKARRFVRGASTITMQLAKNLFLSREKTLSRKIEEVILTDYLEQAFRKDDMMELYLNVIEFGPDVYGITRAADYYFGRKPEELSLPECFFLASLMPSPVRYGRLRDKGAVSEGWMRHLTALMEIAAKNGKVTRAEHAEGAAQPIVFYRPGDPRPEPRKPVSSGRRDPADDDSGWQPLE
ncbi:MAG: transglycosylase domain-containing protein [Labilithrix sp.]|nr:transglycosylase domain-containing protein [Labilithrix sp.]